MRVYVEDMIRLSDFKSPPSERVELRKIILYSLMLIF